MSDMDDYFNTDISIRLVENAYSVYYLYRCKVCFCSVLSEDLENHIRWHNDLP